MEQFQYLGSVVTAHVRCAAEIKRRIKFAKTVFRIIAHLLTNSWLVIPKRKRAIKTYVMSTLLYRCEG